ncbi:hypothetical protein [Amycolatopsis eburnea]|uniref:Uncharacterized protein n=1 Tax=Amycolatopsis eburnea TaxID=2267691 RepID=A0A3R9DXM7_9PSEU|nr:hypothetical protein [Amycolatopsis eburnea]RSD14234.1 hypothetical protein EIY87_32005 [Amycolatopsis eburnea]
MEANEDWDDDCWPEDPPTTYIEAIARLKAESATRSDIRLEWSGKRGSREDARLVFLNYDGTEKFVRRITSAEHLDAFSRIVRTAHPIPRRHSLWYPEEDRITARLAGDRDELVTVLAHRMVRLKPRTTVPPDSILGRDVLGELAEHGSLVTTHPAIPARSIRLKTASPELVTLYRRRYQGGSWVALELTGFGISDLAAAEQVLVDHGTSYLHEIANSADLSFRLWDSAYRLTSGGPATATGKIRFPSRKYDTIPAGLYSAGGRTDRDPLERYLKYYQVLEYYMRQAADDLATRQNAPSIGKATTPFPSGNQANDSLRLERNKLSAVMERAATAVQAGGFLRGNRRFQVLCDPTVIEDVHVLPADAAGNPVAGHDYRPDLVARVYEIRCRIVHAKEGGAGKAAKPLLPDSREARDLGADIEVVRWLADRVLRHWAGSLP